MCFFFSLNRCIFFIALTDACILFMIKKLNCLIFFTNVKLDHVDVDPYRYIYIYSQILYGLLSCRCRSCLTMILSQTLLNLG